MVVVLDTGPLGLITNPKESEINLACARWVQQLALSGVEIVIPEISDYELRRELLRADKTKGIEKLNRLIKTVTYLPLTTAAMRQAAHFWADARQQGQPTAADNTIDGDMILAGQAVTLNGADAVIATTNVGHLARFAPAELWVNVGESG